MIGRSDHYGLQLWRRGDAIEIFPRLCPHEGACLDQKTARADRSISCPWHGRRLAPILRIDLPAQPAAFATAFHRYTVSGDELRITPLSRTEATVNADWTTPAAAASLR
jgi:phenylpropionate dioxygenase-like ring-hydroxylating dioxygenase large terminal subunit